jgi:hypothetical protein
MRSRHHNSESDYEWDVFICYAHEDRQEVALPLADKLDSYGISVWIDEFELRIGDSLLERVDHGLARSRFGIAILSPEFFRKGWPQRELTGLATRELREGKTVILPVWHRVTPAEVANFSLPLADRVAIETSQGVDEIALRVLQRFFASYPGVELKYDLDTIVLKKETLGEDLRSPYIFRPDERFIVGVSVRNTGPRTWLAGHATRSEWNSLHCGPVRIATSRPNDHIGLVIDATTWIAVNRPTAVSPNRVLTSELGTFAFNAIAPDEPGDYKEDFSLVCDGYAWFQGPTITLRFKVQN